MRAIDMCIEIYDYTEIRIPVSVHFFLLLERTGSRLLVLSLFRKYCRRDAENLLFIVDTELLELW